MVQIARHAPAAIRAIQCRSSAPDAALPALALCRQKAETLGLQPTLYDGDMETMRLPRQYNTILVPSSSFQLVLEPGRAQKTISNLYAHLLPAGSLVMPFMKVWKEGYETAWRLTGEKTRLSDGAMLKRWTRNWFDPETQLESTEDRYEVIIGGIVVSSEHHLRSPATREYTQRQAMDLYIQAGFVDLRVYKGFTQEQATDDDEIFTISGVKP